jgi:hypothetical protein
MAKESLRLGREACGSPFIYLHRSDWEKSFSDISVASHDLALFLPADFPVGPRRYRRRQQSYANPVVLGF